MKKILMNNKKGVSGVDITVAISVILIGLSLITSLILSINKTTNKVNREIEATQIAKEIFEKIKVIPYNEFLDMVTIISKENYEDKLNINIPDGFNVTIEVKNKGITNFEEAVLHNISREGNIVVSYNINKETKEVRLPYVKCFDRVINKNNPDLNSNLIISDKTYTISNEFEPGYGIGDKFVLADNIEEWQKYGKGADYFKERTARRLNTDNQTDYFIWEPRYITDNNTGKDVYLIGKTMYCSEPITKTIEYPGGTNNTLSIYTLSGKIGIPLAGIGESAEEGRWIKIDI